MKTPRWRLQARTKGKAYRTVETSDAYAVPTWSAQQYLTADGKYAVRILDVESKIVMRAVPKGWWPA